MRQIEGEILEREEYEVGKEWGITTEVGEKREDKMVKMGSVLETRGPREEDIAFIMSSWLNSYKVSPVMASCKVGLYYERQRERTKRCIREGRVLLGVNREREDQIVGWVCVGEGVLHYLYVKKPFRGIGVGRYLIEASGIKAGRNECSHWISSIRRIKGYEWEYNPFYWDKG